MKMDEQRINVNGAQRIRRIRTVNQRRRQRYRRNNMVIPYHTVFAFLIPLLAEVNVQGTSSTKALFETHTVNTCTFLLALLIYCFASFADMKYSQLRLQVFSSIAVISGSLSSTSLLSMIILPHPFGYFIFILWAVILLLVACLHVWKRLRGIN